MKNVLNCFLFFVLLLQVACIPIPVEKDLSKNIFDTFLRQYDDMSRMLDDTEKRNGLIYGDFEQQKILMKYNYSRLEPYYDHAKKIEHLSDSLQAAIENMKTDLAVEVEDISRKEAKGKLFRPKKWEEWNRFSITDYYFDPQSDEGKAAELKEAIENYYLRLLSPEFLLNAKDSFMLSISLQSLYAQMPDDTTWEQYHFGDKPAIAALYELTRWQYIVCHAEGAMLEYFFEQFRYTFYRFEMVEPTIISIRQTVPVGDEYKAEIVFVAANPEERPLVKVNGHVVEEYVNGKAIYREKAISLGKKKIKGTMTFYDLKAMQLREYPFETEYEVVKP